MVLEPECSSLFEELPVSERGRLEHFLATKVNKVSRIHPQ